MAGFEIQRVESKFFDLDDIIAKSDSTSCTFEIGDLNPDFFQEMLGVSKPTQNADGYGVDAPYWLLESVRSSFSIQLPKAYSVNMQNVLNADSKKLNLSGLQQHFYGNGMQLCRLMKGENPDGALSLARCLVSTLTQRLGEIVSTATHLQSKGEKFDSLETKVFLEGKRCKEDIDTWLRQDNKCSSKKRKRLSL
ncbi:DNA replication complex GINS protein PSF3 [Caenorhabditis elegans]|uniref:DNA replication complex GINS protein PSF3 n=1 Tax=Caenorhabditis elegans TaxID=6239 RepID=Q9BL54_CAEEL|nr:DNA replication complex GINS protein PSF3 [Caenorhabditis elegans]8OUW_C Chain C, DNA replication complex GINS protein PSF3 [Caenorhabditis elegans]CCD71937.1 DNA replication complex GINS protein PSF3 [Caenorhabditis elegans]|eukprot:NP_490748.1 PSF (yeast Partner of Sld Five) conserved replication factor, GINS complex [Caenorhabditis elegans]